MLSTGIHQFNPSGAFSSLQLGNLQKLTRPPRTFRGDGAAGAGGVDAGLACVRGAHPWVHGGSAGLPDQQSTRPTLGRTVLSRGAHLAAGDEAVQESEVRWHLAEWHKVITWGGGGSWQAAKVPGKYWLVIVSKSSWAEVWDKSSKRRPLRYFRVPIKCFWKALMHLRVLISKMTKKRRHRCPARKGQGCTWSPCGTSCTRGRGRKLAAVGSISGASSYPQPCEPALPWEPAQQWGGQPCPSKHWRTRHPAPNFHLQMLPQHLHQSPRKERGPQGLKKKCSLEAGKMEIGLQKICKWMKALMQVWTKQAPGFAPVCSMLAWRPLCDTRWPACVLPTVQKHFLFPTVLYPPSCP